MWGIYHLYRGPTCTFSSVFSKALILHSFIMLDVFFDTFQSPNMFSVGPDFRFRGTTDTPVVLVEYRAGWMPCAPLPVFPHRKSKGFHHEGPTFTEFPARLCHNTPQRNLWAKGQQKTFWISLCPVSTVPDLIFTWCPERFFWQIKFT